LERVDIIWLITELIVALADLLAKQTRATIKKSSCRWLVNIIRLITELIVALAHLLHDKIVYQTQVIVNTYRYKYDSIMTKIAGKTFQLRHNADFDGIAAFLT
jgi:hypothetical protein